MIGQNASDIGCRAAEIPAAHRRLDRDATRAGFAADRGRAKRLRHVSELSQRNARAVVAIDQQRANGVERVPAIVPKAHHEVEAPLSDPDLRRLLADETDPHRSNHIARRQSDARCRLPVHGDLQLRQSRELLGTKVSEPVDASDERLGLLGQSRELVEIRAEDPNGDVGRRPAEPFVDPHAERRREQDRDTGHPFQLLAHVGLEVLEAARAVWLQDDQDVGQRVRHRIFRALRPTCSSHHVLDLGNLAQDVLDPMIQAIDFLECGLGGKHGLQKERPLIQLRHEVAADAKSEGDGRHGDEKRHQSHEPGVPKTAVEQRRIPLLDLAEQEHVFVRSGREGRKTTAAAIGTSVSASTRAAIIAAMTAAASG